MMVMIDCLPAGLTQSMRKSGKLIVHLYTHGLTSAEYFLPFVENKEMDVSSASSLLVPPCEMRRLGPGSSCNR